MDADKRRTLMDFLVRWSELEPDSCKRFFTGSLFDLAVGEKETVYVCGNSDRQSLYSICDAVEFACKRRSWELDCALSPAGEFSCELWTLKAVPSVLSDFYPDRWLAVLDVYMQALEKEDQKC